MENNQTILENRFVSDSVRSDLKLAMSELEYKFKHKCGLLSYDTVNGYNITVRTIILGGDMSIDFKTKDEVTNPKFINAKAIIANVYCLNNGTLNLWNDVVKRNYASRERYVVITGYANGNKIDEHSFNEHLSHELIHCLTWLNNKNKKLSDRYKVSINVDKNIEISKIISDLFYYFDKDEMRANVQKRYQELENGVENKDSKTLQTFHDYFSELKSLECYPIQEINKVLKHYNTTYGRFKKNVLRNFNLLINKLEKLAWSFKCGLYEK